MKALSAVEVFENFLQHGDLPYDLPPIDDAVDPHAPYFKATVHEVEALLFELAVQS